MFSRSEKTEEALDPMAEAPSGQRSPMVLAALAGLLAIAGAFLLVWYLNTGQDGEVAAEPGSPEAAAAAAGSEASKQVLVVTQAIPRGTSVRELVAAPTVYLSARAVPEQFVAASAITSVAELQDLDGLVLASEALPGEQLLRGRFRDPNDFDSNAETFLEANTAIETPALHHAVVFELPASRAMGGNIRAGEKVTVIGNFRATPLNGAQARETSIVVLNSVKVLQIQSSLEVAGQLSQEVDQVGIASRGTFRLTVAVRPEQLTDLSYAIEYGELMLATALVELNDEEANEFPRGITTFRQIAGDDGEWLNELDDGDIVDLVELFPATGQEEEGISVEVELPIDSPAAGEGLDESDVPIPSDDAELVVDEGDEEGAPGDS